MRRRLVKYGPGIMVALCLVISHVEAVQAQSQSCTQDSSIGELVSVENNVEIVSSVSSQIRNFTKTVSTNNSQVDRFICAGDEITVGPNSRASLFMTEPKSVIKT